MSDGFRKGLLARKNEPNGKPRGDDTGLALMADAWGCWWVGEN